ncbi:MAG: DUF2058 domain-containing protein [Granulosicoccus sp.]
MAKSLQEQLKQAGLANQKQMVKARKAKNTKEKMQRKGNAVVDETAELVKQRDAEKLARDRALNAERDRAAQHKAIQAQIQQLVELNTIEDRGDIEYRFDHAGVIKTLMLTTEHRQALIRGALAIVGKDENLNMVPAKVAEKIAERDNSWLVLLNQRDDDAADVDDDYAEYEVPDDLMW